LSLPTRSLKQTAVYWPPAGGDDYDQDAPYDDFGRPVIGCHPVEIKCRWEDTQEEIRRPDGSIIVSKSKVIVDQDVAMGGLLIIGTIDDLPGYTETTDLQSDLGAFEIVKFVKIPTLKADQFFRVAYL